MVGATEGERLVPPPPHSTTVGPTSPYFFPRFIAQPCIKMRLQAVG